MRDAGGFEYGGTAYSFLRAAVCAAKCNAARLQCWHCAGFRTKRLILLRNTSSKSTAVMMCMEAGGGGGRGGLTYIASLLLLDGRVCYSTKQRVVACNSCKAKPDKAVMCLTCTHFSIVMVYRIELWMKGAYGMLDRHVNEWLLYSWALPKSSSFTSKLPASMVSPILSGLKSPCT